MISIPGSLSFAKLVMMSSAPAKSAGVPDTRPKSPIQSRLQSVLGVRSFYDERNKLQAKRPPALGQFLGLHEDVTHETYEDTINISISTGLPVVPSVLSEMVRKEHDSKKSPF